MSVAFPSLCPTRRSYTPGRYPTKRFNGISGSGTTRLYGSKAFDAELQLDFVVDDDGATALLDCWHQSRGGAETLDLPTNVFTGISSSLNATIPAYLSWRWADTPSVESLFPGRSRVQVKLIATLDA